MSFQAEALNDFPQITLNDLGPVSWVNEAFDIQDFPGYLQLLNKSNVEMGVGPGFEWVIQKDNANNAGDVELGEIDNLTDNEVDITAYMPYRHKHGGWLIEERLVTMNGGKSKIHDYAQQQRAKGWGDFVEKVEATIWDVPNAANTKAFRGIQYYLTSGASTGFTGLDATGFSTTANIDADTEARWRNYWDSFSLYSTEDIVEKMSIACDVTKFKTPIKFANAVAEPEEWAPSCAIYTTRVNRTKLRKLAREQNQNLGGDLNAMANDLRFNGMPILWVPQLDSDSLRPMFGVNWNAMKFKVLEGEYMREMKKGDANRHRTQEFHIDLSMNLKCLSRRRQWRLDYAA